MTELWNGWRSDTVIGCPELEQLERLARNELADVDHRTASLHIESCPECRQHLSDLMENLDLAEEIQRRDNERELRPISATDAGAPRPVDDGRCGRAGAPAIAGMIPGYEILLEIHRGGQGVVYQAIQRSTNRKVAIKVLLGGALAHEAARKRFDREIAVVASLKHPNIIAVFDSGVTRDGHQYCVMDYVSGVPLDRYVSEMGLGLEETLKLFGQVCNGVNYAHQKGVIHRDLKPTNILVDSDDTPRILDFGLARTLGDQGESLISLTGQIIGTVPYMSPEQATGSLDEIDIRTDVYALGVILYDLLTGHFPYPVTGSMSEVLNHITETAPTPPTRRWTSASGLVKRIGKRLRAGECPIDRDVETIVLKALSKERQRRYQSAGEFARDLERYLAGEAVEARRDSTWYMLRKLARRNVLATTVIVCLAVILGSSSYLVLDSYHQRGETLRELERKESVLAMQNEDLSRFSEGQHAAVRQMALGWFLAEYQEGRLERAREIRDQTPRRSREYLAMTFLLDDEMTAEALAAQLPAESAALVHFAAGERHLKHDRLVEAVHELQQYCDKSDASWLKEAAIARLRQRAAMPVEDSTARSGDAPGSG